MIGRQVASAPGEPHVEALQRAVQESGRTLWSIAAAVLGRRDDAEDVVQEAVVVALGKRDELSKVQNYTAWLGQIVRFIALNRRRPARIRMADGDEALNVVAADSAPPLAAVADRDGRLASAADDLFDDNVLRALNALDEMPRACLLLRVLNDLSYREIGAALDIPEGTAMSHVFRARRAMLQRLTDMGDSRAATPSGA